MPDYDAERTHAFFAAKDAISTGRDPMKAALRHLAPNGVSSWIDNAIAEHAVESAKGQDRSNESLSQPPPPLAC